MQIRGRDKWERTGGHQDCYIPQDKKKKSASNLKRKEMGDVCKTSYKAPTTLHLRQ